MEDIFKAISNGEDELLRSLLSSLTNVNQQLEDHKHFTIAHHAASVGTYSIVKQVLALQSIDLTVKDDNGKSPLHIAVLQNTSRKNSESIVHLFLEAHANVSAVDNNKQTPLHIAMLSKDIQSVRELVEFEAPKDVLDKNLSSPMSLSEDLESTFGFYMDALPVKSFPDANMEGMSQESLVKSVQEAWTKQLINK
jgi:ankyrin repeat protein